MTPVEIWFDILRNMTNFAKRPAEFGARYERVFEASRQSPFTLENQKQYLRSMFDYKERSYLTEEDRAEIRGEAYMIRDGGIRQICTNDNVLKLQVE